MSGKLIPEMEIGVVNGNWKLPNRKWDRNWILQWKWKLGWSTKCCRTVESHFAVMHNAVLVIQDSWHRCGAWSLRKRTNHTSSIDGELLLCTQQDFLRFIRADRLFCCLMPWRYAKSSTAAFFSLWAAHECREGSCGARDQESFQCNPPTRSRLTVIRIHEKDGDPRICADPQHWTGFFSHHLRSRGIEGIFHHAPLLRRKRPCAVEKCLWCSTLVWRTPCICGLKWGFSSMFATFWMCWLSAGWPPKTTALYLTVVTSRCSSSTV